jgi:hypothetical protein
VAAKPETPAPRPTSFDEMLSNANVEIDPTGDGAAYLVMWGKTKGLWYLRGSEVTKVREVPQLADVPHPSTAPSLVPMLNKKVGDLRYDVDNLKSPD